MTDTAKTIAALDWLQSIAEGRVDIMSEDDARAILDYIASLTAERDALAQGTLDMCRQRDEAYARAAERSALGEQP